MFLLTYLLSLCVSLHSLVANRIFVAKTMIFVSAFFVVTWTPLDVYYLLIMINSPHLCCACDAA